MNKDSPDFLPKSLNEWGDSFAGIFSPVAFLWLVLGYLQQGEELRNSSNALHLQAEELKHSVIAQSELVEVSRQQLQQEINTLAEERERKRIETYPKLTVRQRSLSIHNAIMNVKLEFKNFGGHATEMKLFINTPADFTDAEIGSLQRLATMEFTLPLYTISGTIPVQIFMKDANAQEHVCSFDVIREKGSANVTPATTKLVSK